MKWWREAKFGLYIHYGLYSILGRHEWVMNRERIPLAEYEALAGRFTAEKCDPRAWARLAKDAGQKYVIMTTKHHEGFSLWNSAVNPFNAMNSPARRDLVAEFVEAVRAEGLHVGLYYSLMDWHHPDGARCFHDPAARRRFVDYTHSLVRELVTNYGHIDILWYDVPWPLKPDGWESARLNYMVRSCQPHILINNRSGMDSHGSVMPEDFDTPENVVKASPPYRDWESCDTLNHSWGYNVADNHWKSVAQILGLLVSCAGLGGNYILNVGPRGDGSVQDEAVERLRGVGRWLRRHGDGESIYGAERATVEWMNFSPLSPCAATVKGHTLYWHISHWYGSDLWIGGLKTKVLGARLLSTGQAVKFRQTFASDGATDRLHLYDLPAAAPDPDLSVLVLECDGKPLQQLGAGCVWMPEVL